VPVLGRMTPQTSLAPTRPEPATGPALVVAATSVADVRAAVLAARHRGAPLAVRATGHGTHAPLDGAVLLDTSALTGVLVDPDRAVARVGAGALWSAVHAAAAPFGLAGLSGSHVGVGVTGYTLGGGLSWLSRRFGLAAHSMLRAEVVLADGRRVVASADEHADLFWALRGGGTTGIVTSLEFRLHRVPQVLAGTAYFPLDRAVPTLTRYRDWIASAPDALSTAVLLAKTEDGQPALAIRAMYAGDADAGRRLLAPLFEVAGTPFFDGLRAMPFAAAAMGGTPPVQVELFDELPDAAIEAVVAAAATGTTVEVRQWGGAIGAPQPGAGPVGARGTSLTVIADAPVPGLADHATGGAFLNFLRDTKRTADAFTPADLRRLRAIKRAYDPTNLFRAQHTV
jgi:FAD/FMN-containing dehydrogenase